MLLQTNPFPNHNSSSDWEVDVKDLTHMTLRTSFIRTDATGATWSLFSCEGLYFLTHSEERNKYKKFYEDNYGFRSGIITTVLHHASSTKLKVEMYYC